jgi:hypothetical protein
MGISGRGNGDQDASSKQQPKEQWSSRLLERVSQDARGRQPIRVAPVRQLASGALLIREWGGTKHQVTVLERGVMFRGESYRSLSEVARVITGNRWSGPLFFGLKARLQEVSGDGAH